MVQIDFNYSRELDNCSVTSFNMAVASRIQNRAVCARNLPDSQNNADRRIPLMMVNIQQQLQTTEKNNQHSSKNINHWKQ